MNFQIITPDGDAYAVQGLAVGVAHLLGQGDRAAFETMRLALDLDDMDLSPDVWALIESMMSRPKSALLLLEGAPDIYRTCIDRAIAAVYCGSNPGTWVSMGDARQDIGPHVVGNMASKRMH